MNYHIVAEILHLPVPPVKRSNLVEGMTHSMSGNIQQPKVIISHIKNMNKPKGFMTSRNAQKTFSQTVNPGMSSLIDNALEKTLKGREQNIKIIKIFEKHQDYLMKAFQ